MNFISTFSDFVSLNEAQSAAEQALDEVLTENLMAAIGSPLKYRKIKKAAGNLQKAYVQKATNDIDFEKRKAAGRENPKGKEVLAAAHKAKNDALDDKISTLNSIIDDEATNEPLKRLASISKNQAKLAAAEIAYKAASGEEAKQLKVRIAKTKDKISSEKEALKDYERDTKKSTSKEEDDAKGDKGKEKEA